MNQKKLVTDIVEKIKTKFNPQKIILFGSCAWGEPNMDSDIDLFLIMETNLRRDERSRQVQKIFWPGLEATSVHSRRL